MYIRIFLSVHPFQRPLSLAIWNPALSAFLGAICHASKLHGSLVGPPSGHARRGRARQATPAYARTRRSHIAAHSRARLALQELSQSLSLKARNWTSWSTLLIKQPSGMLQSRRWNLMLQRQRSWTSWPRELASAAYLGRSQIRIGLVSDFLLPQAIIYDLIDIRFPLRIQ